MLMDGSPPSISSQRSRTLRAAGDRVHRNRFVISESSLLSVPHRWHLEPQITGMWSKPPNACGANLSKTKSYSIGSEGNFPLAPALRSLTAMLTAPSMSKGDLVSGGK